MFIILLELTIYIAPMTHKLSPWLCPILRSCPFQAFCCFTAAWCCRRGWPELWGLNLLLGWPVQLWPGPPGPLLNPPLTAPPFAGRGSRPAGPPDRRRPARPIVRPGPCRNPYSAATTRRPRPCSCRRRRRRRVVVGRIRPLLYDTLLIKRKGPHIAYNILYSAIWYVYVIIIRINKLSLIIINNSIFD